MNYKKWLCLFLGVFVLLLFSCAALVAYVDPFFHYHKPRAEFFYKLNKERYQNDGILRHFAYDALITGTSMTENFRASEFDRIFNVHSVKVPYSGGTYRETGEALKTAYRNGRELKCALRSLDLGHLIEDRDALRRDLGTYPEYLYNDKPWDDVNYILNKDAVKNCLSLVADKLRRRSGGITSFDEYANWNKNYKFGKQYVVKKKFRHNPKQKALTAAEREMTLENIRKNVVEIAKAHPHTTFYNFFPPYSIAYWAKMQESGKMQSLLEAQELAVALMLECPNIKLYDFALSDEIITHFPHYKDDMHYGEWINSRMLQYIFAGKGLLTKENYREYFARERAFLASYDYESL